VSDEVNAEDAAAPVSSDGSEAPAPADSEIDDANDLQGFHFKRLLRSPLTWLAAAVLAIGAGVAGAIFVGPVIGAAAAAGAVVLVVAVVFFMADSQAENAFFDMYAQQRDRKLTRSGDLRGYTPLLRKGDERSADQIMRGPLAKGTGGGDGIGGTLALYTYTDVYHDKNGRHESHYHFTVAITKVEEVAGLVPELICNRKFGFRAFNKLEDAFRDNERVTLESLELDDRFEIFVDEKQDPNWVRQLFSPTFMVWLCDETPEGFAFELVGGILVCNIKGHKKKASELDAMCDGIAGVARRLREEAAEGSSQPAQQPI